MEFSITGGGYSFSGVQERWQEASQNCWRKQHFKSQKEVDKRKVSGFGSQVQTERAVRIPVAGCKMSRLEN